MLQQSKPTGSTARPRQPGLNVWAPRTWDVNGSEARASRLQAGPSLQARTVTGTPMSYFEDTDWDRTRRGTLGLQVPKVESDSLRRVDMNPVKNPKFWVILDTNQLFSDFRFRQPKSHLLLQATRLLGGAFCFPALVLAELQRAYDREAEELRRVVPRFQRLVGELPGVLSESLGSNAWYAKSLQTYLWEFRPLLKAFPEIPHEKVVERMFGGRRPFRAGVDKPEVGYRDFLIWCTIVELLLADSSCDVKFVTSNHKDFFASPEQALLAPDLLSDLHSYDIPEERVTCFRDREDLTRDLLSSIGPTASEFLSRDPMWYARFRDTHLINAINKVWNLHPDHREGEPGPRIYAHQDATFAIDSINKRWMMTGTLVEGTSYHEWFWHYGDPGKLDGDNGDYTFVRTLLGPASEPEWIEIDKTRVFPPFK